MRVISVPGEGVITLRAVCGSVANVACGAVSAGRLSDGDIRPAIAVLGVYRPRLSLVGRMKWSPRGRLRRLRLKRSRRSVARSLFVC